MIYPKPWVQFEDSFKINNFNSIVYLQCNYTS